MAAGLTDRLIDMSDIVALIDTAEDQRRIELIRRRTFPVRL